MTDSPLVIGGLNLDELEGIIWPGDVPWFPATEFEAHSYLFGYHTAVTIAAIQTKREGSGALSRLINKILADGRTCRVSTPSTKIVEILSAKGFAKSLELTKEGPLVEIWSKTR